MKNLTLIFISCLFLLTGCDESTDPVIEETEPLKLNGELSFNYNGVRDTISIYAQANGYSANEVVFRGSGKRLDRTLMLTFSLTKSGKTKINESMTGYWDLGLCIPFDKYLLTNEEDNYIKIDSYDQSAKEIEGIFRLNFRYEEDSTKTAAFEQGKFKAKINTSYPFEYCIEG